MFCGASGGGEAMVFWVNPPDGWEVDVRHVTVERPPRVVSQEPRLLVLRLETAASREVDDLVRVVPEQQPILPSRR